MTRNEAIELARKHAQMDKGKRGYCEEAITNPNWLPHEWVIDALLEVPKERTGWIVVKEHVWDLEDGGRPELAYLWPAIFNRQVYASFEEAQAFMKSDGGLPLGWVAMKITIKEKT